MSTVNRESSVQGSGEPLIVSEASYYDEGAPRKKFAKTAHEEESALDQLDKLIKKIIGDLVQPGSPDESTVALLLTLEKQFKDEIALLVKQSIRAGARRESEQRDRLPKRIRRIPAGS